MSWVWTVAILWVALAVVLAVVLGRAIALADRRRGVDRLADLDPVSSSATRPTDDPGQLP